MANQHSMNPTYQELARELNSAREDMAVLVRKIYELATLMRAARTLDGAAEDLLALGIDVAMEWANSTDVRREEIDTVLERVELALTRKVAA